VTAVTQGYRVLAMPRPSTGTVVRKPTVQGISYALKVTHQATSQEPEDGLEPTTYRLQGDCSTN
jgi:hypothetical protein